MSEYDPSLSPPSTIENVVVAQELLESKSNADYFASLNNNERYTYAETLDKINILVKHLPEPTSLASIGVGNGEEILALDYAYRAIKPSLYGVDLSPTAITVTKEHLHINGVAARVFEASLTDLPFESNALDGIILSALLHEVYSYMPNGGNAVIGGIMEAGRCLKEGGLLLIRDQEAPPAVPVAIKPISEVGENFYNFFSAQQRLPSSRRDAIMQFPPPITDLHIPNIMNLQAAAEILLHFKTFMSDFARGSSFVGDTTWKELGESYLVSGSQISGSEHCMNSTRYVETIEPLVLEGLYKLQCIVQQTSQRPQVSAMLTQHFEITDPSSRVASEKLLEWSTNKMELLFRKVSC